MIGLVEEKRNQDRVLLSGKGALELTEAGVVIRFDCKDGRKSNYIVLIEKQDILNLNFNELKKAELC